MTIDEAIKHCEEIAEAEERSAKLHQRPDRGVKGSGKRYLSCIECANDHRQLAEWLRELKAYRNIRRILSQNRIATDRYGEVVMWDDIKRVFKEVNADEDSN